MSFTVDGFNLAKSKMLNEFNKAITEAEELRKSATEVSGDGPAAVPGIVEEKSGSTGARPEDASRASDGAAAETAATTDGCVHDGP